MKWVRLSLALGVLLGALLPLGPLGLGQGVESVKAFVLDNGLQVLLADRPGVSITTVDMWVNTGSLHETAQNAGISHFFEHMLFKGTPRYPGGFDAVIEGLGGRSNASTSFDWTHYYITVPGEHTATALDIMADITQNAAFPEEEIVREKEVVLREMDQRSDDPTQYLFWQTYQEFFKIHPYGLPIVGTQESLDGLTRDDFLAYMQRFYTPDNMVLVVAGDFDEIDALVTIRQRFAAMSGRAPQDLRIPQEPEMAGKALKEIERDVGQGYLVMAWRGPSVRQAKDVYAMDVLLGVLSQGRGSRFYQNIQKLGLVRTVNAGYLTQKDPGLFTVYAEFPYENRGAVEQAVLAQLRRILSGDVSPQELERAKTILLSSNALSEETNSGLAGTLGFYSLVAGDYRFAQTYPAGVRAVTVDDLVETARAYVDLDRYLQIVLIPQGQAQAQASGEAIVLGNGLKLIVREDHSSNVIALQTFVGTGLASEPRGKEGIASLTQQLLLKGTTSRSEDELFEALENLGAHIGTGVLDDMAHLSLVATADTLDRALPLYLDALLHPAFPAQEVERTKQDFLKEIAASADQNFNVIYDNFKRALYGNHPYGHSALGTEQSIGSIAQSDVVDFYRKNYAPNNMTVVAVGNFDARQMQALLAQALGGLEPGEAAQAAPTPAALDAPKQVEADKRSNLTWMVVGYPGPSISDPDYPAMKLLNAVLGGGSSSRLFQVLRDQQGLAYSTGAFFPSLQQNSHLATYIIALPENAQAAQQGILGILQDIKDNGVEDEELERAKNYVVGNYLIDHETAARRAWYLGWYEMLGAGAAMDEHYPELIRALTSADVQQAATKYLNNYVVSVLGPGN